MIDLSEYLEEVVKALKVADKHYPAEKITLNVASHNINYYRWLHPWQGDWEVEHLFTPQILGNLSKIIKPGSTVIDIGAQTGNMSVAYSIFAEKVIAFEPNPATFEVLNLNSTINKNIDPYPYAISDKEGSEVFHYSDEGFCNGGFATRTERGVGVTGHTVPIQVYKVKLEEFLSEVDVGEISLIKIDAEGHDKDILKTIGSVLHKHKPVLITEIYNGLTQSEIFDLLDTIHSLGYKAYDEEINKLDIDNLGSEIKTVLDIQPGSGHNLICIHGS